MTRPIQMMAASALALSAAAVAFGLVNLELRPVQAQVNVGDVVEIGLYAVSDSGTNEVVRALQVILQWDPTCLTLDEGQPLINNGPYAWLMSGFYPDSGADGLNNTWADGNAYYQAVGNFQSVAYATPAGLLVTTFRFNAQRSTPATPVTIPPAMGLHTRSQVFGAGVGEDVTGTLGSTAITIGSPGNWGTLALELPDDMCGYLPGQTVAFTLTVSNLAQPINGTQALIAYPADVLTFLSATPGDGAGSPWGAGLEVYEAAQDGVLVYALLLVGGGSSADAVVARLAFRYAPASTPAAAIVALLAQDSPLQTRLTDAATGAPVIPDLGASVVVSSPGDINTDGFIDLADFSGFATCMGGPVVAPCCSQCCRVDFARDEDVDLADFRALQLIFGEP